MPNGTRKSQSTRHSNNVRNGKKEQAKRNAEAKERQKAREAYTQFGIIDDESNDTNTRWAKRVARDLFFTPRNKIVLCCEDNPRATQIVMKYIRKNGGKADVVQGVISYIDNKTYWCSKEEIACWLLDMQKICKIAKNDKVVSENAMTIILGLLVNPPKCNGEKYNISCGFLGSIWIDTTFDGVDYRIGLYNAEGKNYDIKDFKPTFLVQRLDDHGFTIIANDGNERVDIEVKSNDPNNEKDFQRDLTRCMKVLEKVFTESDDKDKKQLTEELLKTTQNKSQEEMQQSCLDLLTSLGYDENFAKMMSTKIVYKEKHN